MYLRRRIYDGSPNTSFLARPVSDSSKSLEKFEFWGTSPATDGARKVRREKRDRHMTPSNNYYTHLSRRGTHVLSDRKVTSASLSISTFDLLHLGQFHVLLSHLR